MKPIYLFITIIAGFLFFSCGKEEISGSFELDTKKSFKINKEYQSDSHLLKFKITKVNDSRCPMDVECIWAGKVDVSIEVKSPATGNLVLSTINNIIDKSTDTLGNYSFQLIKVLPYPVSTKTIDLKDYEITLKIEALEH